LKELNKRLDLDIEEFLESPKLRLKLSPAELDKSLLELYDNISGGPSGDILRLIGGGGAVGLQNMYMRQKAQKDLMHGMRPDLFPRLPDEAMSEEKIRTPTQWVQWAMRKNIPKNVKPKSSSGKNVDGATANTRGKMKMCLQGAGPYARPVLGSGWPRRPLTSFVPRQRSCSTSLLI